VKKNLRKKALPRFNLRRPQLPPRSLSSKRVKKKKTRRKKKSSPALRPLLLSKLKTIPLMMETTKFLLRVFPSKLLKMILRSTSLKLVKSPVSTYLRDLMVDLRVSVLLDTLITRV